MKKSAHLLLNLPLYLLFISSLQLIHANINEDLQHYFAKLATKSHKKNFKSPYEHSVLDNKRHHYLKVGVIKPPNYISDSGFAQYLSGVNK